MGQFIPGFFFCAYTAWYTVLVFVKDAYLRTRGLLSKVEERNIMVVVLLELTSHQADVFHSFFWLNSGARTTADENYVVA